MVAVLRIDWEHWLETCLVEVIDQVVVEVLHRVCFHVAVEVRCMLLLRWLEETVESH